MSEQLVNFGSDTLNGAINNSTTSVVVNNGSLFPATGNYHVLCDSEIMRVTARSSNTFTVVRGVEGTTAVSHTDTTPIKLVLSAEALESFYADRITAGGYASRPSSPRLGQIYCANDIDLAWRYSGSNWDLIHPVYVPYANRVDVSSWTSFNLGTSVWTDFNGILNAAMPQSSGDSLRGYSKNIPSAPYTLNCIVRPLWEATLFNAIGIGLSDGTKYKAFWRGANSNGLINIDNFTTTTGFNDEPLSTQVYDHGAPTWLRIQDDNTNWKFFTSQNGLDYVQVFSQARNSFLTATKAVIVASRRDTTHWLDSVPAQVLAYWET